MTGCWRLALAVAGASLLGITPAEAKIKNARAGPKTGQYGSFGEQMRPGAEVAVRDINARGCVLHQNLRLEIGDDACVRREAALVADDRVSKGGRFVPEILVPAH